MPSSGHSCTPICEEMTLGSLTNYYLPLIDKCDQYIHCGPKYLDNCTLRYACRSTILPELLILLPFCWQALAPLDIFARDVFGTTTSRYTLINCAVSGGSS